MSDRPRTDQRGFTLLECEVAMLLLAFMLLGLLRLSSDHEQLVKTLDRAGSEPLELWVRPHDVPAARTLGRPAQILEREPAFPPPPVVTPDDAFVILESGRDLEQGRSWARVQVAPEEEP